MTKSKVPKLRFPEFSEEWEERKLKEILDVNSGKDYKHLNSGDVPVFGTGGYMLSVDESLSEVDAVGLGRKGTINRPQLLVAPFWTVDTLFFLTPKKHIDLLFLYGLIQSINWLKYDESTGVPSLSRRVIDNVTALAPSYVEQQKIGSLLKNIDTHLSLHKDKLKELELQKKALLQKMFPKKGKTVPELRFPGFTDAWEQRKLDDLFIIGGSGGTPRSTVLEYYGGNIPFLSITDISNSNGFITKTEKYITDIGLENSSAKIFPAGTISLAMYASVGKLAITKVALATSQAFYNMTFDDNDLRDFVYHRLEKAAKTHEWEPYISTGTQANLNATKVKNFKIFVPSNFDELRMVSSVLSKINDLITLHQRKLEMLKLQKKALLQQMFV